MKISKLNSFVVLSFTCVSLHLFAIGGTAARCERNSLSPTEAIGRFEWLKKCPRGRELLVAHAEVMAHGSTRGLSDDEIIKRLEKKYILDPYQLIKFGAEVLRAQPDYFVLEKSDGKVWAEAPTTVELACEIMPLDIRIGAICRSSCYHPDTALLFPGGEQEIALAQKENQSQIMTLTEDSTFAAMRAEAKDIDFFVVSREDFNHHLVRLTMQSGKQLLVTQNHPLVTSEGLMLQASMFKVGDSLVQLNGLIDPIVKIDSDVPYFGKVYNVKTTGETPLSQVVFAEGYLSGSDWYQNEAIKLINSRILRRNIADKIDF